jgi:hypothetical protein
MLFALFAFLVLKIIFGGSFKFASSIAALAAGGKKRTVLCPL